jgi:hypothetical protein
VGEPVVVVVGDVRGVVDGIRRVTAVRVGPWPAVIGLVWKPFGSKEAPAPIAQIEREAGQSASEWRAAYQFLVRGNTCGLPIGSADVQYRLPGDPPGKKPVNRTAHVLPRRLELHRRRELSLLKQLDEAREVARHAQARQFVHQVECVDPRSRRAVEAGRSEGDDLVRAAGGEIDDQASRRNMFDRRDGRCRTLRGAAGS